MLLTRLARDIDPKIDLWEYPTVKNCVLWYAILDGEAWTKAPERSNWIAGGLQWCLDMYRPLLGDIGEEASRLFLMDLAKDIGRYPPTLFVAAKRDPVGLLASTRVAHAMLLGLGETKTHRIQVYDATHGFIAYPPQIQALFGAPWETTAVPATQATIAWIKGQYSTVQDIDGLANNN